MIAEGGEGVNRGIMRESEITELLKELSKRAKELGFPQDVKEGDWIWDEDSNIIFVYAITDDTQKKIVNLRGMNNYTLILEFSRCLTFLRERGYWFRSVSYTHLTLPTILLV